MIVNQWKGPNEGLFVQISCEDCGKERIRVGTHALRALQKENHYCMLCFRRKHNKFKRTQEMKANISKGTIKAMASDEIRKKIKENLPDTTGVNNAFFGKKHTEKSLQKIRENNHYTGVCNPWWKPWMSETRNQWAKQIRKAFEFCCAKCEKTKTQCQIENIKLDAHHIAPVSSCPELRYDLNNGISLCRPCHTDAHHLLKRDVVMYEYEMKNLLNKSTLLKEQAAKGTNEPVG